MSSALPAISVRPLGVNATLKYVAGPVATYFSALRQQARPEMTTSESPFLGRPGQVVTYSDAYAALVKADLLPTLTENDIGLSGLLHTPGLSTSEHNEATKWLRYGKALQTQIAGLTGLTISRSTFVASLDATFREAGMTGSMATYSTSAGLGAGQTIDTKDHLVLQIHATPTLTTSSVTDTTRHFRYTQRAPGMAVVTVNVGIAPILDPFAGGFSQVPPFSSFSVSSVTVDGHPLTSWPVLWQRALAYGGKTGAETGPLQHGGFSCSFVGSH